MSVRTPPTIACAPPPPYLVNEMNTQPKPSESSAAYLVRMSLEAGNEAAAHTCPLCGCARSAPHRRLVNGEIVEGCVSAWHEGWVHGDDAEWHNKPRSVALRAMAAWDMASLGETPAIKLTPAVRRTVEDEAQKLAGMPTHGQPGWRPVVVLAREGRRRPVALARYSDKALGDLETIQGFDTAQIVAVR